jgi:hypothetical protein
MARPTNNDGFNVYDALEKRFAAPAYAFFTEVGNATGSSCSRHADAVAMSLWPSRGLELIGIEIKSHRSDWVRERDNPEKAEAVYRYMDRWYLVVTDPEIIKPGELPKTWGLLVPRGDGLVAKVEAPELTPEPVNRKFVAALMRKFHEKIESYIPKRELQKALNEQYQKGLSDNNWKQCCDKAVARIKKAEEAVGLSLEEWNFDTLRRAVALTNAGDPNQMRRRMINGYNDVIRTAEHAIEEAQRSKDSLTIDIAETETGEVIA